MGNIDLSNINIANIQTISGMTMSEILNRMKSLGIGISGDNYTIRDYSDIITGNIVSGAEVTMGGYSWIVTSIQPSERVFYMISKDVISKCKFRDSAGTYPGSTLATTAKEFAAMLPSNVQDALIVRSSGGISQKCHAPTFDQITTWFAEDSSRIAMYESTACKYWLCDSGYVPGVDGSVQSDTSYALIVDTSGACSKRTNGWIDDSIQESVTTTQGFRAVVALMM